MYVCNGKVSLAIEQDSSFVQDWFVSENNCRPMANLTEVSGIPNSIGYERSVPALASLSAPQLPEMSL